MLCFQGMSDLKCGLSEEGVQNSETPCPCRELTASGWKWQRVGSRAHII